MKNHLVINENDKIVAVINVTHIVALAAIENGTRTQIVTTNTNTNVYVSIPIEKVFDEFKKLTS